MYLTHNSTKLVIAILMIGLTAVTSSVNAQKEGKILIATPTDKIEKATMPNGKGENDPQDIIDSSRPTLAQRNAVRGYVMTHEHPTSAMAFGGNYAFTGAAGNFQNGVMENAYTMSCSGCALGSAGSTCNHGRAPGALTALSLGRDTGPHNSYFGPVHNSFSHIRYSTEWIREAFMPSEVRFQGARMKIMVAYALESEAMCGRIREANLGAGGENGDGFVCTTGDSFTSLERQLLQLVAWADAHDWMEIAYTAADARRIASQNKLVIVLGVEAEYAFGAENRTFDPVTRLDQYHELGVRTFYLAHKVNSRLSGADIYHSKSSNAGKAFRATQAIAGCLYVDDNVRNYALSTPNGYDFCRESCGGENTFQGRFPNNGCITAYEDISELSMASHILKGGGTLNGFAAYPRLPGFAAGGSDPNSGTDSIERNNLGLSTLGTSVVTEAMRRGMMINIDHISSVARRDVQTLATKLFDNYPLNAFHNNPNEMLRNQNSGSIHRSEYDFSTEELLMVRDSGGFFGVRLAPLKAEEWANSNVTMRCDKSSTENAQILSFLIDLGLSVGYSLDLATVTEGTHSRTFRASNNGACDTSNDWLNRYRSPLPSGLNIVTTEGLSHIGMMKYWHTELEAIGLNSEHLDQLKNDGAEQFIRMWERSEAKSEGIQQTATLIEGSIEAVQPSVIIVPPVPVPTP